MHVDDRPCRADGVVWRRGVDGVVVLNPHDGTYFTLDDVAGRIWELCEGRDSVAEIAATLANEYDATPAVIQSDAVELLSELRDEGLVVAT